MRRPRRRQESGYALLIVLLIGALIAISLYREIPRIAFETQRQKEQLLIDRGEQYKRAIQLFAKANGSRYPTEIKDLESFNNVRYLRKRFVDPMTGKDEWRVVHISNGILQDSVNMKKKDDKAPTERTDTYVGLLPGIGQAVTQPGAQGANIALRRRPSDNAPLPSNEIPIDPSVQQTQPGQQTQQGPPGQLGQLPVNVPPGLPGMPGVATPGGTPFGNRNGLVGAASQAAQSQSGTNQNNSQSSSSYMGGGSSYMGGGSSIGSTAPTAGTAPPLPTQPGFPVNSQTGSVSPPPSGTAPGSNGVPPNYPQPGPQTGAPPVNAVPNPATQMINNLLTQPRPGGAPTNTAPGGMVGAGIAGFASTLDSDSIKIYNDHQNYSEWEFIYDPAKQKPVMNPVTGQIGTPASQLGSVAGAPGGTPAVPPPSSNGIAKQ